mmetsp:Transcript_2399/g.5090  ORF Transcript_2399/g.5090 Transcript_2399/m.5090 type:complete len:206 (+) Transcript_2399:4123-4740(+)
MQCRVVLARILCFEDCHACSKVRFLPLFLSGRPWVLLLCSARRSKARDGSCSVSSSSRWIKAAAEFIFYNKYGIIKCLISHIHVLLAFAAAINCKALDVLRRAMVTCAVVIVIAYYLVIIDTLYFFTFFTTIVGLLFILILYVVVITIRIGIAVSNIGLLEGLVVAVDFFVNVHCISISVVVFRQRIHGAIRRPGSVKSRHGSTN